MRIRTVKPEFWSHPVLAALPDDVRLAAVGLLNVADDEGYFLAKPALIRSELWPLDEDSTKARRVLAQLSEVGWIEVREHQTHGPVGRVVNFAKHQRVDRPSPSKIKAYFLGESSTNDRRTIDERSSLDQGAGNRDQVSGGGDQGTPPSPQASPVVLPPPQKATNAGRELLDILRTNGCKMELGAAKLLPEWFEAAGDLPLEWVAYVIKKRKAKLPSDLRKGLKELEQEFGYWTATRKGASGP